MLLKLNFCTSFFQLRFDLFGFFFGYAFFDCFGSTIYEVFSFFQTQTGDVFNGFHNLEFSLTSSGEDYVERGFFGGSFTGSTGSRSGGNGNSSSSGLNSVFVFQNTSKFVYFFNCQVYQLLS